MFIVKVGKRWVKCMINETADLSGELATWDQAYRFLDFASALEVAKGVDNAEIFKINLISMWNGGS